MIAQNLQDMQVEASIDESDGGHPHGSARQFYSSMPLPARPLRAGNPVQGGAERGPMW